MAKFNDIRELAQQNARWVSNSPKDWMNYLDVAARLYRYSFKDTLLIHASVLMRLPVQSWKSGTRK